jgi:5,10-methylenetetrahydrofolate reductase
LRWRAVTEFDGPIYAGVLVVPSVAMARKISGDVPQLAVPANWISAMESNADAGVDRACTLVADIKESGAVEGVHLIPVSKYREVSAELEARLRR